MRATRMFEILASVRLYVEHGLLVIPLFGKVPLPQAWQTTSAPPTDVEISEWVRNIGKFNVGALTGRKGGMVGIDIDGPGAESLLAEWSQGDLPATWEFATSPGRRRLLYRVSPDGQPLRKVSGQGRDGHRIELLGDGQQTVMPPSVHPDHGKQYEWIPGHHPEKDIEIMAEAPSWLIERMSKGDPQATSSEWTGPDDPAPLQPMLDGCPWLRHTRDDAETLSEAEWVRMIWLLTHVEGGQTLAHNWSAPYDGYTEKETQRRFDYASKKGYSPPSCENIAYEGGEEWCSICTRRGKIKSPISLARKEQKRMATVTKLEVRRPKKNDLEHIREQVEIDPTSIFNHMTELGLLDYSAWAMFKAEIKPFLKDAGILTDVDRAWSEQRAEIKKKVKEFEREAQREAKVEARQKRLVDSLGEPTAADFFDGETFQPPKLEAYLRERETFLYTGDQLYIYRDGVYLPEGRQVVARETKRLLGDKFVKRSAEEVINCIEIETHTKDADLNRGSREFINVRNGLLDWRTGKLYPHSPKANSLFQINASYKEDAKAPAIERFLNSILSPDIVALIEEIIGYLLIPLADFDKSFMFVGAGSNGKSTLIELIGHLLGPGNYSCVSLHSLEGEKFKRAELHGRLANFCTDLSAKVLPDTELFKKISAGEEIDGERKFGQPFKFVPYSRLLFSTNKMPASRDTSDGYYRRWIIVPFTKSFRPGFPGYDPHIKEKLIQSEELSGLLNMGLRGLRRLMERKFFELPPACEDALGDYKEFNDSVLAYIVEHLEKADPDAFLSTEKAYQDYRNWCDYTGRRAVHQGSFNKKVEDHFGVEKRRKADRWRFPGVRFASPDREHNQV